VPEVSLGNVSPIALITDPDTGLKTKGRWGNIQQSTCNMRVHEDDFFKSLGAVVNLWSHESDQPPAWVDSDDPDLTAALRKHFGCGGKPEDWQDIITGPASLVPFEDHILVPVQDTPAVEA
jgi:hypothetical protein